jgi:hypothetical protein
MSVRTKFRLLVVVQLVVATAGMTLSYSTKGMPPAVVEYIATQSDVSGFYLSVGALQVLLEVVTFLGLMLFWRPVRWLYVADRALLVVAAAFGPTAIQTSLSWSVFAAALILSGVIVALSFTSPVADEFSSGKQSLTGAVPHASPDGSAV